MKLCGLLVAGTLALALQALGEELKLEVLKAGSTVYSNVTILRATATDLYFRHEGGIKNVKLKYVSPELQSRFGYDAAAAAEAERRQAELEKQGYATANVATTPDNATAKLPVSSEDSLADPLSPRSLLGQPAPALQADQWLGEKPALQGKCVLYFFLTSWSAPSRKLIPDLNALSKRYPGKLVVVGVGVQAEGQLAAQTEPRMEFPCVVDPAGRVSGAFDVTSVPQVALVDPKGRVHYVGHPGGLTERKLAALVAQVAE